jgi:hypothetical protein
MSLTVTDCSIKADTSLRCPQAGILGSISIYVCRHSCNINILTEFFKGVSVYMFGGDTKNKNLTHVTENI